MSWQLIGNVAGKDVDSSVVAELRSQIAELRSKEIRAPRIEGIQLMVAQMVEKAMAIVPTIVEAQFGKAVAAFPRPKDGRSVTVDELMPVVSAEVQKAVALIPVPKDGLAGPPVDPSIVESLVKTHVKQAVSELPKPQDGRTVTADDVKPLIASEVAKAIGALPRPKDGTSVTVDDVRPIILDEIQKAAAAIPRPKDGIVVLGALIDREGHLVLTLSDGGMKDLGSVVGKDGLNGLNGKDLDHAEMTKQIEAAVALIPKPKDGKDGLDGLGFDDLTAVFDDEQGFLLRFQRGDQMKEFPIRAPFDTGRAWEAGRSYVKGAGVRCDGGFWLAKRENVNQKPGQSDAWVLSAKRGKDGKDGKDSKGGDE